MSRVSSLIVVLFAVMGAASFTSAQQIHLPPSIAQGPGMEDVPVTTGSDAQKQQAMAANEMRQQEIRRDTEKMAELTQELKNSLLKSDQGVISVDTIKKAEQIEKLAHSVKSKLKQSY
jgi:TolA-binding protein